MSPKVVPAPQVAAQTEQPMAPPLTDLTVTYRTLSTDPELEHFKQILHSVWIETFDRQEADDLHAMEERGEILYTRIGDEALAQMHQRGSLFFREDKMYANVLQSITYPQGPLEIDELIRNKEHMPPLLQWRGPVILVRVSEDVRVVMDGNHRVYSLLHQDVSLHHSLFCIEFTTREAFEDFTGTTIAKKRQPDGRFTWGCDEPTLEIKDRRFPRVSD